MAKRKFAFLGVKLNEFDVNGIHFYKSVIMNLDILVAPYETHNQGAISMN